MPISLSDSNLSFSSVYTLSQFVAGKAISHLQASSRAARVSSAANVVWSLGRLLRHCAVVLPAALVLCSGQCWLTDAFQPFASSLSPHDSRCDDNPEKQA